RAAGAVPDPAAGTGGRDRAAAGRANRQPRPGVGRGPARWPRGLRGNRRRGDPRPLVRSLLRPLPGLRRRWRCPRVRRAGLGRGPRHPRSLTGPGATSAENLSPRAVRAGSLEKNIPKSNDPALYSLSSMTLAPVLPGALAG